MNYRPWLLVPILLLSNQMRGQAQSPAAPNPVPRNPAAQSPAPQNQAAQTSTAPNPTTTDQLQNQPALPKRAAIVPRIAIHVDAPDEMKRTIELYMNQELAKAVHHPPVDHGEQWQIQIVAFDPDSKKHAERFSMAVAFIQKTPYVDPLMIEELERNHCLTDARLKDYEKKLGEIDVFQSLSTWDGRIGELRKTCKSIVEDFANAILGPANDELRAGTRKVLELPKTNTSPGMAHPPTASPKIFEPPPIPLPPGH